MSADLAPGAQFLAQQAVTRYALALDRQDLAELEELHTEDAVWEFSVAGGGSRRVAGRAQVLEFVAQAGDPTPRRHHVLNSVVVDSSVERDVATAELRAYLLMTAGTQVVTTGTYRFVLRDNGSGWRIAELALDLDGAP